MRGPLAWFQVQSSSKFVVAALRSPLCNMHRLVIVRSARGDTGRRDVTDPSALL